MRVSVNGISIHYEVRGRQGPALIMLHGNCEDMSVFDRAVNYLEQVFTVYLVDSRGHGESSSPLKGEYHYRDMADDLYDLIRKLKIESPMICGYSDGGIVALIFASEHPEIPSRLFVCGANTNPGALKGMGISIERMRNGKDPRVQMMLTEPDLTKDDLSRISCPVLVVAGSRDCVRESDTDFIVNSVQNGKKCIMKRADHSSYIVHSTRIVDAIFGECDIDPNRVRVVYSFAK